MNEPEQNKPEPMMDDRSEIEIENPTDEAEESPPPGDETVEALRKELALARAEAHDRSDEALRLRAEMENLRRRTHREMENARKFALERFMGDLLEVRDTLSNARLAAYKLSQARTELEGAETDDAQALDDALAVIEAQFVDEPYRYSPIMLLGQLQYLYGNLDSADQEPGRDAIVRHDELAAQLEGLIADLERLLGTMRD